RSSAPTPTESVHAIGFGGRTLMASTIRTAVSEGTRARASTRLALDAKGLRPHHWLVLSAWCGLVCGLLEVALIVLRKHTVDLNQFYWMSRHFVWLIPLTNLLIFLVLGLALAVLTVCWPRRGSWLGARLLCALALLPLL